MADKASRARSTQFTDVLVTNEQTGACWSAGKAEIHQGLIRIELSRRAAPPECTEQPKQTFTLQGRDAAGRQRSFVNLVVDRDQTTGSVVVFR